jgi:hypothetical protein
VRRALEVAAAIAAVATAIGLAVYGFTSVHFPH